MGKLRLKAYGKINLSLDIIGKRFDGYHNLCMVIQNVSLYDEIYIELCQGNEINIESDDKSLPLGENNIAYKAAKLFLDRVDCKAKVNIYIKKIIPKEAGMGGGSADAAAVLVGLNHMMGNLLKVDEIKSIGSSLGADVPFFIEGGTSLAEGIGDILTRLNTPKLKILIVKPKGGISTRQAYKKIDINKLSSKPNNDELIKGIKANNTNEICKNIGNVFYNISRTFLPEIEKVVDFVQSQKGCMKAMMTGTGSAVFGIFENYEDLDMAEYNCKIHWENVYKASTIDRGIEID